jgi:hypothetical protein
MNTIEKYREFCENELPRLIEKNFLFAKNTKTTRKAIASMIKFHFEEKGLDLIGCTCNDVINTPEVIDSGKAIANISFWDEENKKPVFVDLTILNTGINIDKF